MIDPADWDRDAMEQELQRWTINIDPAYLLRRIRLALDPDDCGLDRLPSPVSRLTMSGSDPARPHLGHVMISIGKA
jgi:hypothetical protein